MAGARVLVRRAADPAAEGGRLAWHRPGERGVLLSEAGLRELPGERPALGGGLVAWLEGDETVVADAATLAPRHRHATPDADALALSATWLAWRARRREGGDVLLARPVAEPGAAPRRLAAVRTPRELGRPALAGGAAVLHVTERAGSRIDLVDLASGSRRTLLDAPRALLANPVLDGETLLYVRAGPHGQALVTRPLAGGEERVLYATHPTGRGDAGHEPGKRHHRHGHPRPRGPLAPAGLSLTLWTTALAEREALVTRLRQRAGRPARADLLAVAR